MAKQVTSGVGGNTKGRSGAPVAPEKRVVTPRDRRVAPKKKADPYAR